MPPLLRHLLLALLVLPAVRFGYAAINPEAFKNNAPEILELRIEEAGRGDKTSRILLRARVLAVRKSAAGVRVGDTVLIRYTWDQEDILRRAAAHAAQPPRPGPQFLHEPEPPAEGAKVLAHLAPAEGPEVKGALRAFRPAAHQYSFTPLP